jgi:DUF1009 family protein
VESLGLIAGTGYIPFVVAQEAKERGYKITVLAFRGITDPALEHEADETFWIRLGQLTKAITICLNHQISRVVMAGKIDKINFLQLYSVLTDLRALKALATLQDWKDDTILKAIGDEFAKDGIHVEEITEWAQQIVAPRGVLTKQSPTKQEWIDIEFGRDMAKGIGKLDIGQTVVVKNSSVIAAEAIEGTDKAIRRAGDLAVQDCVVVKMAKPQQDMRYDVPGVGPTTIESMIAAKARVLAVEAGKTLIPQFEDTIQMADEARITIVGIPHDGPVS